MVTQLEAKSTRSQVARIVLKSVLGLMPHPRIRQRLRSARITGDARWVG
jgi:hypothetical protein